MIKTSHNLMVDAENNTKNVRGFLMKKFDILRESIRRQVPVDESFDIMERQLTVSGKEAVMYFVEGLTDREVVQRIIFSLFTLDDQHEEAIFVRRGLLSGDGRGDAIVFHMSDSFEI